SMHIAVLGNEGSWYVADLERAGRERGHVVERLDFSKLTARVGDGTAIHAGERALKKFDAVIVRTMPPGSLEQVVYRMDVLATIEAAGIPVLNSPKSLECAVDKYLTTCRLAQAGLPVPSTIVCEDEETALMAFEQLGGDVIVKPLFGSEGRGILRVSDPDLALRTFRTLSRIDAVLYLQKFIPHAGFDLRVMVLDGEILGGMRRYGNGDFRTNVARNGRAEPVELSEAEQTMALTATKVTGARFAGVDLLYGPAGECYVIEVNAVPGWRAFAKVTGMDVAGRVMERLQG
ncbi:MAG: RimK family alpha-L-glutamate ligase, partial [Planctomycetota bacterium]|nr:RimK family alpha-L-glutamate ligase [Planctomycetota bacterium]